MERDEGARVFYVEARHEELDRLFGHFYTLGSGGRFEALAPGAYRIVVHGMDAGGARVRRNGSFTVATGQVTTHTMRWP